MSMSWRIRFNPNAGMIVTVFAAAALIAVGMACGLSSPTAAPTSAPFAKPDQPVTLVLTHAQPSASAEGELVAPGREKQKYTLVLIDTRDFQTGGTINFEVSLGTGESDGSFDLFPEGVPIPTEGRALDSVATLYDLPRASRGTMSYKFTAGQVFQFGATGNWFSREGATNTFSIIVTVE